MLDEFNEPAQPKTSLANYPIEFNDFFRANASVPNNVFEAVRQTLHITVCEKVCRQTRVNFKKQIVLLHVRTALEKDGLLFPFINMHCKGFHIFNCKDLENILGFKNCIKCNLRVELGG